MATTNAVTDKKITFNFGWQGSNIWRKGWAHGGLDVRVVDLHFKNTKMDISVHLPEGISPTRAQKIQFTCRKGLGPETTPDSLNVSVDKILSLRLKAGFFEESPNRGPGTMDSSGKVTYERRVLRNDREIKLALPEELEIDQTYTLVVTSDDLSLSAALLKESDVKFEPERSASPAQLPQRMHKMGEALIAEGLQNLALASRGGAGVFDSSSTSADVLAHGLRGVVRAGQQMHPELRVPQSKPSETPADLDKLTPDELQSRFDATFKRDKEFESERMQAARAGDLPELNRIIEAEQKNSQLLSLFGEALERKGIQPKIPQSAGFQSAARQADEAHAEAIRNLPENCRVQ